MPHPAGPRPRTIAFVSLKGFYTGLAERARSGAGAVPGLPPDTGRPLLVGRHGEVLEASPELALSGVAPGMSRREATYAAPEARWVDYDPGLILPAAEKFWRACAELTPRVEPVADHEAFLDLTGTAALPGFAAVLRRALDLPGLSVCCGVAGSRLVARLAAQRAAAGIRASLSGDACRAIPPGGEAAFLAPLPVSALWTVPSAVHDTLGRLGLSTVGAVFSVPEEALYRLFGPEAFRLLRHARGEDSSLVPLFDAALATLRPSGAPLRQEVDLPLRAGWSELEEAFRKAAQTLAADLAAGGQSCLRLHFSLTASGGDVHKTTLTPQEPPSSVEAMCALAAGPLRRLLARDSAPPRRLLVELELAQGATQLVLPASFAAPRRAVAPPPAAFPSAPPVPLPAVPPPPSGRPAPKAASLGEVLAAVNRAFASEVLFPAARLTLSRRERLRRLIPGFGHAAP